MARPERKFSTKYFQPFWWLLRYFCYWFFKYIFKPGTWFLSLFIFIPFDLATSCEELTHWKRLWCWEGLGAGKEGDDQGWDGWMASLTRWTRVWVNSGRWWWTGRPGVLRFMGSQRVGHDRATELNWTILILKTYHGVIEMVGWLEITNQYLIYLYINLAFLLNKREKWSGERLGPAWRGPLIESPQLQLFSTLCFLLQL